MQINPYLHFNGDCEEAFKFYEQCLGGKIEGIFTYAGTPAEEQVPPEWRNKILHARLTVGDAVLMGCDVPAERYQEPKGFSVILEIKDPAEAERIFQAMAENGKVKMAMQETFWATRFGMLADQFGIPWMVNCYKAA